MPTRRDHPSDIKPSNVMVTHHDGRPVPKVIDFGIAKATNQRLTEKTLFTHYGHLIGTPAYMSPEQAELSDLDIDTRSDIYSLGVLLYELSDGTDPFSEEELRKAGYAGMQRIIREMEPTKPSTKLSTLGDTLTDIARCRSSTPDLLRRSIRGDLDWIVMKALEKDRRSRLRDCHQPLQRTFRRHLECEPVSARRAGVEVPRVQVPSQAAFRGPGRRGCRDGCGHCPVPVEPRSATIGRDGRPPPPDDPVSGPEQYAKGQRQAAFGDRFQRVLHSQTVGPEPKLLCAGILAEDRRSDDAVALLRNLLDNRAEIAGPPTRCWPASFGRVNRRALRSSRKSKNIGTGPRYCCRKQPKPTSCVP